MRKVRTLDYTLPEICDSDAADLINRLLVRHLFYSVNPFNNCSMPVQTTGP